MSNFLQQFAMGGMGMGGGMAPEAPPSDTSEKVQISSLSLLKMLKHGRAGVPMEVMGLMLGQFVDDYTITCVDVFAMPQHGTGVSVEAVDPVFQQDMLDMLKQTGRPEMVVGWYHSHPGFGCWMSGVDQNTQQSFEQLNKRAVAVVIDPIQSVKGKVVIDAFRLIQGSQMMMMTGRAPEQRQTTSIVGHLKKPTLQARIHDLDKHYYSLVIDWRRNDLEEQMLMNVHRERWTRGFITTRFEEHSMRTETSLQAMVALSKDYQSRVVQEEGSTAAEVEVANVGKVDPKRRLEEHAHELLSSNILQCLGTMLDTVVF